MRTPLKRLAVVAAVGVMALTAMPGGGAVAAGPPQLTKPVHATKGDLNPQRT
jgi:hypothetical protein